MRGLRLRLPLRWRDRAVGKDSQCRQHVPHLHLRHRELPMLRPFVAQRMRKSNEERHTHLRLRALHGSVLRDYIPPIFVVRILGKGLYGECIHSCRVPRGGAPRLCRHTPQRRRHTRMATTKRRATTHSPRGDKPHNVRGRRETWHRA